MAPRATQDSSPLRKFVNTVEDCLNSRRRAVCHSGFNFNIFPFSDLFLILHGIFIFLVFIGILYLLLNFELKDF